MGLHNYPGNLHKRRQLVKPTSRASSGRGAGFIGRQEFEMDKQMAVEAAAAASAVAAKSAGGAAMLGAGAGVAAGLSMLVVMLTKKPRTDQEWLVAIISTVVSSLCGGAVV